MAEQSIKRNNWVDGQLVTLDNFSIEQTAWHDTIAANADTILGSGVQKGLASDRVLFDTNDVPASVSALLTAGTFDGVPFYATDTLSNTVFLEPSDVVEGNQLAVEISGASLTGSAKSRVYLFGLILGGSFTQEVLEFDDNGTKLTRNYFTSLTAIMTQNFRGNTHGCLNTHGRMRILEASALAVATDHVLAEQTLVPNQYYVGFIPASLAKTLDLLLGEIATVANKPVGDLGVSVAADTTRSLPINSVGLIIGEKFQATTNNIQRVSVLLSITHDLVNNYDWSGDLVLGIRALQRTVSCPIATIPDNYIEFDPEPSALAEVSFTQATLASAGVVLTATPQVVDFVFTQSLLANPSVAPSLVPGNYYVLTVGRTGDLNVGNLVLQESYKSSTTPTNTRLTVFSQNEWVDVAGSDTWFRVYTSALRVTSGTAFDAGVAITSPKAIVNSITGAAESYINGGYSLLDVSSTTQNYVIVQRSEQYSDELSHPTTGNKYESQVKDYPSVSVVSAATLTELLNAGNETIVLASVVDTNPALSTTITGYTRFAGLATSDTFTIIAPVSDLLVNNLVGATITPDLAQPTYKYRITKAVKYVDDYGDVNGDGVIDVVDEVATSTVGLVYGFSKDLSTTLPDGPTTGQQHTAIVNRTVTMDQILRGDVTGDGIVSQDDAMAIHAFISSGTAFAVGGTYNRLVLTVENLTDPLTSTPDIVGHDPSFNNGTFTPLQYQVTFVPLWSEENLVITDLRRFVTQSFTSGTSLVSGGSNSLYIPGDLLLGGSVLTAVSETYNFDLEVATISIDLAAGTTSGQMNVFDTYIRGKLKFYDGTLVSSTALTDNQVRVSVAIQSLTKDGFASNGGIVDQATIDGNPAIEQSISILYVQSSGLLRIRTANQRNIATRPELSTKLILTVYLKKAGFQNTEVDVSGSEFTAALLPL